MTLGLWLRNVMGIDPETIPCLALGTDGLSVSENHLVSVSYKKGPETRIMYVQGADLLKIGELVDKTGVSPEYYKERALPKAEVVSQLKEALAGVPLVISYAVQKFTGPWLSEHLREVAFPPIIPIEHLLIAHTQASPWPEKKISPELLKARLNSLATGTSGQSFTRLLSMYAPEFASSFPGKPELEMRPLAVYALWVLAQS